ncbi:hypothetical protein [Pseudanabaena sp. FACHB-2040]|uniref:hypothetical protein n=1 Tax=Pseudanabaena sp. FACHB-2040 TaxID=2692859 RepID=UPI001684B361|nr:hypothetical protein [Pseudanabaena sp. FACHB-2040]MBD0268704.1 hypothetical protein [Cyanobacteria bacterium Co-bin8]MBD2259062.1 hypothetical protein [Pseudanabaena sp. FACHB-2040]
MDFAVRDLAAQSFNSWDDGLDSIMLPWTAEPESGFSWAPSSAFSPVSTLLSNGEQAQAMVLAQQFDQDVLGDMGNAWNTFIQSGQVWALVIGVVLGYLIRGMTTY